MPTRLIATLKSGIVLQVPFPDRETAEGELRFIERLRHYRWGLPELAWCTVDGQRWVLGIYDLAGLPYLVETQPTEPVAG